MIHLNASESMRSGALGYGYYIMGLIIVKEEISVQIPHSPSQAFGTHHYSMV